MITVTFIGIAGRGSAYTVGSLVNAVCNRELVLDFLLTLSGTYGTATSHGDILDFTSAAPNGFGLPEYAPTAVFVRELVQAGSLAPGFQYLYCPAAINTPDGSTPADGVLQITGAGAGSGQGGTEITQGAAYSTTTPSLNTSGGTSGQQLLCRAWFGKT